MKHGSSISTNLWLEILNDRILDLLKINIRWGKMEKEANEENGNIDGWQECCLMLLQIIIRCLKKFQNGQSSTNEETKEDGNIEEILKIWRSTQDEVISLLQLLSGDSLAGILGCIKEVCKSSIFIIFQSQECLEKLLKGFLEMCKRSCEFNLKFMKAKVTEEIINIFIIIFDVSNNSKISHEMTEIVFECMKTILMAMKDHDKFFTNKNPAKLTFDEKQLFSFIEFLGCNLKNNEYLLEEIINTFMKFSIIDPHLEAFARRSLVTIYNLFLQGKITEEQICKKIIPILEERVIGFMEIRYKEDEAMALAINATEKMVSSSPKPLGSNMGADKSETDKETMRCYLSYVSGCIWLRIVWFILSPNSLKESLLSMQNEEDKNDIDNYLGLKQYGLIPHEKIDNSVKFSSGTKSLIYNMIQASLDSTDEGGILYSSEKANNLEQGLKHEVEITSVKLDERIMEFVNTCLVPYKESMSN